MNEQACSFVCAILFAVGAVLTGYSLKTGDMSCYGIVLAIGVVVCLLSGYVILYRYI